MDERCVCMQLYMHILPPSTKVSNLIIIFLMFLGLVYLHHGPWSWTMEDDRFHDPTFIVWFVKTPIHKAFGPLSRCRPNEDQEEWQPCTKKWTCSFKNKIKSLPRNGRFGMERKSNQVRPFSCLHLLCPKISIPSQLKMRVGFNFTCRGELAARYRWMNLLEFEKLPVGVWDFVWEDYSHRSYHFRGIHRIYIHMCPNLIKWRGTDWKMST